MVEAIPRVQLFGAKFVRRSQSFVFNNCFHIYIYIYIIELNRNLFSLQKKNIVTKTRQRTRSLVDAMAVDDARSSIVAPIQFDRLV